MINTAFHIISYFKTHIYVCHLSLVIVCRDYAFNSLEGYLLWERNMLYKNLTLVLSLKISCVLRS